MVPLWQREFFLVNCLVLRRLLTSERSGVVKTFRWATQINRDRRTHQGAADSKTLGRVHGRVPHRNHRHFRYHGGADR